MKMKKILVSSLTTIALAASLASGATYALFTANDEVNIAITSGKVKVSATISNLKAYSNDVESSKVGDSLVFANGGLATLNGNVLNLDRITPMDKVTFDIDIINDSNVRIQYRTLFSSTPDDEQKPFKLFDALQITIKDEEGKDYTFNDTWSMWDDSVSSFKLLVTIELPESVGNDYMDLATSIKINLEAAQGNAYFKPDVQQYVDSIKIERLNGVKDVWTIEYGSFPQELVTDPALITRLENEAALSGKSYTASQVDADNITVGATYEQVMQQENPEYSLDNELYVKVATKRNGDSVYSNESAPSGEQWFKVMPLKWIILNAAQLGIDLDISKASMFDGKRLHLLAFDSVMGGISHSNVQKTANNTENKWEYSFVRRYLSEEFAFEAFNSLENKLIATSNVTNTGSGNYDSNEKIYLLDNFEKFSQYGAYYDFFANSANFLKAKASNYAIAHRVLVENGYTTYYLRSNNATQTIPGVTATGAACTYYAYSTHPGIRPLMQVTLY